MIVSYLQLKVAQYLATLDDSCMDDWYDSAKGFANGELSRFLDWLSNNE